MDDKLLFKYYVISAMGKKYIRYYMSKDRADTERCFKTFDENADLELIMCYNETELQHMKEGLY